MGSTSSLKIVIVGVVAGGMSAATRARRLNENLSITVFEKGPYVSYTNCGISYALGGVIKDHDALILQSPKDFKDRFNIDVHVNTEVLAIDREKCLVSIQAIGSKVVKEFSYDKLILSQGAEPFCHPFKESTYLTSSPYTQFPISKILKHISLTTNVPKFQS